MNRLPTALRAIGFFFIMLGVSAAINIVVALFQQRLHLDFNLLGLWIGAGLLRSESGSVRKARNFLLISIVACAFVAFHAFFVTANGGTAEVRFFGRLVGEASAAVVGVICLGVMALAAWQRHLLGPYDGPRSPALRQDPEAP
jgi:hypothetical protein